MQALVLGDKLELRTDHPPPRPAAGEALLRVRKAGICNTDLELVRGYLGFRGVLGHELVGTVEALPAGMGSQLCVGTRVVAEINCVPPGSPSRTAAERAQEPSRTTLGIDRRDGAFAELVTVPIENLHPVPESLTDDEALFAEPLAAACQILEQVHVRPSDRVCVLGDGKLGLLCAQVLAAASGCELTALGRHPAKLAILKERGIRTQLASDWDRGRTADLVVDCTGTPAGLRLARSLLRPRGTLVLKSTYAPHAGTAHAEAQTDLQRELTGLVIDEITAIGSRCGPFPPALRLLSERKVAVTPLIHARYALSEALTALERAASPGILKVIIEIA